MDTLSRYLDDLAARLPREPRLREEILAEVEAHLRARARALAQQSLDEEASMRQAVERFGPAEEIGEALAQVHRGGTWREGLAGGLVHLLAGLVVSLPVLPWYYGGPWLGGWRLPLEIAFGVVVAAVSIAWGRRRRWAASWVGYGLLLAFGLGMAAAQTLARAIWPLVAPHPDMGLDLTVPTLAAFLVWVPLAAFAYLRLTERDRLSGVLAAMALVPFYWSVLMLDEVVSPPRYLLVLAVAVMAALATTVAIRLGDERRGLPALVAGNLIATLPVYHAAIYATAYPAVLLSVGGLLSAASVIASIAAYVAISTVLLLGPLWFRAGIERLWGRGAA
ncbi:MAG: permease prefix domain 1-containing protein [Anaerolineae bacterium]|nr:permease prefix domain 1-containing protein [Anaerolineae bacterium]